MRCLQAISFALFDTFTKHTTFLLLMDRVYLLMNSQQQAVNFFLLRAGSTSVTIIRLRRPRSSIVSALVGAYSTVSLASSKLLGAGADKAAVLGSEMLIVLLDHARRRAVVKCACGIILNAFAPCLCCSGVRSLQTMQMLQNAPLFYQGHLSFISRVQQNSTYSWKGVARVKPPPTKPPKNSLQGESHLAI